MKHETTVLLAFVLASVLASSSASAQLTRQVRVFTGGHESPDSSTTSSTNQGPDGPLGLSKTTFGGRATASANYGFAKVYANFDYPGLNRVARYWSQAQASFRDVVTINHPTLNGTTGQVTITYQVDVNVSSSGQADFNNGFNSAAFSSRLDVSTATEIGGWRARPDGAVFFDDNGNIFNVPRTITANFVFGEPFYVGISLSGTAYAYYHYSSSNLVDAANTSTWGGINSVTSNGNPVTDYTVTSDSGTDYRQPILPPRPVVVSRHLHNGSAFDLPLPLTGAPAVEPRTGGPAGDHQIVLTFQSPTTFTGASVTSGTGSVASASGSGTTVIALNLTGVSNAQALTVKLSGVNDGTPVGDIAVPIRFLLGDSNGDSTVNSGDATQTKGRSGLPLNEATFRSDYNLDGTINSGDAFTARSRSGTSVSGGEPVEFQ